MLVQRKTTVLSILTSFLRSSVLCFSISQPFFDWEGDNVSTTLFGESHVLLHSQSSSEESESFLINTPGCHIPNYAKTFKYNLTEQQGLNTENACGIRAVFVNKDGDDKIIFRIDELRMKKYAGKLKYSCCFKFAYRATVESSEGENKIELIFTKCKHFKSGTKARLDYEIISVSCKQKKKEIYNDAYMILKKLKDTEVNENAPAWNVLLIGVHAMSRARLAGTMPKTFQYLENYNWLDYRGYQKVGFSTFPNLMSLLTGRNISSINAECQTGLYKCADYFIWNKFKAAGYKTAYGEDYLELPDILSKFGGFRKKPTHHYMRPFYRLGERPMDKIMCTGRQPSATHLLKYALSFAKTYLKNPFLGVFWINSYSHYVTEDLTILDQELSKWFHKLDDTGVLNNTFVIFFSDHGIKYGDMKLSIESYYDERLPMLFLWTPYEFQKQHHYEFNNMILNQHRLITPYDLYITLGDILKVATNSNTPTTSMACPQCTSLFHLKSQQWTCSDAKVSENGCSCRTMHSVEISSAETVHSLELSVAFINNVTLNVRTIPCMICRRLTIRTVLRSHTFHNKDRLYNVIAFEMSNLYRFEATIVYRGIKSRILHLHTITAINKKDSCVEDPSDRPYCDCVETLCEITSESIWY